jgi:phosphoglycolate phosphatase
MSKAYELVVFDWEGTLADTLGQILQTVSAQATTLGLGELDQDLARQYTDLGLNKAVQKLFPNKTPNQHEQLLQSVQRAMLCRPLQVLLIPGAEKFIKQLQEAHSLLAVASNKGQQSLQRAIHATGLDKVFFTTRSAGQTLPKPHTQMLEEIMDFCSVDASKTLMIGDSPMDMEMAVHCGVDALGVDFYHQQRNSLIASGAQAVFDDYVSLAVFLNLKS